MHRVTEVFLHMVHVEAELLAGTHSCHRSGSTQFSQRANSGPSARRHKSSFGVARCALDSRASQRFSGRELSVHSTAVGAGAVDDLVDVLLVITR